MAVKRVISGHSLACIARFNMSVKCAYTVKGLLQLTLDEKFYEVENATKKTRRIARS